MQLRSEWRSSVLLRYSFIYGSNWLSTARQAASKVIGESRLDEFHKYSNVGAAYYEITSFVYQFGCMEPKINRDELLGAGGRASIFPFSVTV